MYSLTFSLFSVANTTFITRETKFDIVRGNKSIQLLPCKIGQNDIFVLLVLVILDQYPYIGPKILARFQNFKNIGQKNIGQVLNLKKYWSKKYWSIFEKWTNT